MLIILGIGNILRGDDGIGPEIIRKLQKEKLPDSIRLFDIGSDAFAVIDFLLEGQKVLVIDCAQINRKPGEALKFDVSEKNIAFLDSAISLHGYGFKDVYNLAKKINNDIKCTIIGIQPKSMIFNSGLSPELSKSIPVIMKMVMKEIKKYAKKNNYN